MGVPGRLGPGLLSPATGVETVASRRVRIGQMRAMASSVGIVLYFAVATVWVPSALLTSSLLIGVDRNVSDFVALVVWYIDAPRPRLRRGGGGGHAPEALLPREADDRTSSAFVWLQVGDARLQGPF